MILDTCHAVVWPVCSPAVQIQSTYPFSSRSSCCCRLSFRKETLFSTRSRSFANSLDSEVARQD